ncbi:unnamed protein product [Blepharisma stoltei]|uniref:Uncharacterized protein n=1 Tax=Blepharisma stoltei TaxID=1481888 RepID=A0AAU9KAB3_9CILI|nr:unnamed protein product [Blepharisma stoltei]
MRCYNEDCNLIPDFVCACSLPPVRSCSIHLSAHLESQSNDPHYFQPLRSRVKLGHMSKQKMISGISKNAQMLNFPNLSLLPQHAAHKSKNQKKIEKTLANMSIRNQNENA